MVPDYKSVCNKPDVMKPDVAFNDEVCYLNVDSTSTCCHCLVSVSKPSLFLSLFCFYALH